MRATGTKVALAACALAVLALTLPVAAADREVSAIHGAWKLDVDKTVDAWKQSEAFKKTPAEEQKATEEFMRGFMAVMSVSFTDGEMTLLVEGMDSQTKHDFKVTARNGAKWTVETKDRQNPEAKVETGAVEWTDDDNIVMVQKDGPEAEKLFLIRKK